MNKKAQITMESLLLYGLAILVVIGALAALTYFGVFDTSKMLPEKCDLSATGIFKCQEYLVDKTNSQIDIVVENTGSKIVEISAATITFEGSTTSCTSGATVSIMPGETGTVTTSTCVVGTAIPVSIGNRAKASIILEHTFNPGTLTTKTNGELIATVY